MGVVGDNKATYSVESICAGLGIGGPATTDCNDRAQGLSPSEFILGPYR